MKAIVFDIGGTLMEYKGMPLSWLDYYKTAFEFIRSELDLDITDDDIDKSFEVMKSYNPRINPREYDVSPEVILLYHRLIKKSCKISSFSNNVNKRSF